MNPDIIAAIVAFLQGAMRGSLSSSTGYAQVYSDFEPEANPDNSPVATPYAVVMDGPETYTYESQDPATGHWLHRFADGMAQVRFYATTKVDSRALARLAVKVLTDSDMLLTPGDGPVLTIFPPRSDPVPLPQAGIGQPTVFCRAVTFQYKQEFGA